MDSRVSRITMEVRKYDPMLYAVRASNGMIQIHRQSDRIAASNFNQMEADPADLHPLFILALTDDWSLTGKPVEWGLEPVMRKLMQMDAWTGTGHDFEKMKKAREQESENRERAKRNKFRAMAADMRRDFAKATNDINTAGMR